MFELTKSPVRLSGSLTHIPVENPLNSKFDLHHSDMSYSMNSGINNHNVDAPSIRIRQPPGGACSNIFGGGPDVC